MKEFNFSISNNAPKSVLSLLSLNPTSFLLSLLITLNLLSQTNCVSIKNSPLFLQLDQQISITTDDFNFMPDDP